jgi:hypothetical protein
MQNSRWLIMLGLLAGSLAPTFAQACRMTPYGLAWHELKALVEHLGNPSGESPTPISSIYQQGPDMWVVENGTGESCLGELFETRLTGADCTIEVSRVPTFAPIKCRSFSK